MLVGGGAMFSDRQRPRWTILSCLFPRENKPSLDRGEHHCSAQLFPDTCTHSIGITGRDLQPESVIGLGLR